jgi:hypothetical protein
MVYTVVLVREEEQDNLTSYEAFRPSSPEPGTTFRSISSVTSHPLSSECST